MEHSVEIISNSWYLVKFSEIIVQSAMMLIF